MKCIDNPPRSTAYQDYLLGNVMSTVVKTVNMIWARGLHNRQFQAFLSEVNAEYRDLLYHSEVCWPSCCYVQQDFKQDLTNKTPTPTDGPLKSEGANNATEEESH